MEENVQEQGTTAVPNEQTDAGTAEQLNGFKSLLAGMFKGKETEAQKSDTSNATTEKETAVIGMSKEEVGVVIEEAKKQWMEELAERERKKSLSPEEAAKEEKSNSEREMEQLRKELLENKLKAEATSALDKLGYPVGLAELINYNSKDTMDKSLKVVEETFKTCLEMAIKQRLKGKTPEGLGGTGNPQNDLRDQIAKGLRGGR